MSRPTRAPLRLPDLEQEFFDTADGFSKWCNAAGGINGRKIVVDKLDAKLFNVGQVMTQACQKDFMLVGNGNAFDSAGVKIRERLQARPDSGVRGVAAGSRAPLTRRRRRPFRHTRSTTAPCACWPTPSRMTKTGGVGIAGSSLASLVPTGLKAQEYLKDVGIKIAGAARQQPVQVDNYRPYIEQLKQGGVAGVYQVTAQDPSPIVQAMKNVGYNPSWILYSVQFYGPQAVQAAKALGTFPPSYVQFTALPFELANKYPVLQQTEDIVHVGGSEREADELHAVLDERLDAVGAVGEGLRFDRSPRPACCTRRRARPTGPPVASTRRRTVRAARPRRASRWSA